ncbi:M14 family metallopeptidase [Flagellimonas sp. S3867]|uniref:M14 family metallopeptidase n=1 Tax=Flagellimonas sp. S3867 TaxID=2768063 RepID=UPI001689BD16|nr:M14 family metallopeptidase [Flagellimonas sp. S3867]
MKNLNIKNNQVTKSFLLFATVLLLIHCTTPKKVKFKDPVDTKDKQITYQAKKTYQFEKLGVWVSNEFEGAHLNGASQINDSIIVLKFNPENIPINKSPYYAFKTWSDTPKQIYFGFDYPEGFEHRYKPKQKLNGNWSIVDSLDLIELDERLLLKLKVDKEPRIIAAQEINASENVRQWYLQNIVASNDFVRVKSVGNTKLGKDMPVLDIYNGNPEGKPIIVLLTRQHPPEVTGYFAFQNFLKTIVDQSELSIKFLNHYRVLAFPILNPDGVDLGHWRHNANGIDLNRDWSKYRQPEVKNVVSFITNTSKEDNGKIVLGLDFHSTYEDVFYTNETRAGTTLPNFIDDWFLLLEKNIEGYKVNEKDSNSNKPVSKGWFLYGQNATGITYEIGDHTPKERIVQIGSTSAKAMMEVLLKENL